MKQIINRHQFLQLVKFIRDDRDTFGIVKLDGNYSLTSDFAPSDLVISGKKSTIPFKKIILPNNLDPSEKPKKLAFIGLPLCDVHALHIFLKQFAESDYMQKRDDILIIAARCTPDKNCFCNIFGANKLDGFDIYLDETDEDKIVAWANTDTGKKFLEKLHLKEANGDIEVRPIDKNDIDLEYDISKTIESKEDFLYFWQKISNICFGCGACTAVCPLCYCTRINQKNDILGDSKTCLKWDSCFAKEFSEIQNHFDFRPENLDRLYNWYHHKFVRGKYELDRYLCTGCGRCIKACPADINIKNILSALDAKIEKELKKDG